MSDIHTNIRDNIVYITLGNRFDFNSVNHFRDAYSNQKGTEFVVDFRNTEYMDSSGLGMLLNMKRHLENITSKISLTNCRPQIKKVLMISRFDKKFAIK